MNAYESDFFILSFNEYSKSRLKQIKITNNNILTPDLKKQFYTEIIEQLSLFQSQDPDLEKYITSGRFIEFEKNHYCRNYFVLSSLPIQKCNNSTSKCSYCCAFQLDSGCHKVLGYFSLAVKTIDVNGIHNFPSQIPLSLGKIVHRPSRNLDYVESYLVGHLSKNYYNNYNSEISGSAIFIRSLKFIEHAHSILGTSIIQIDCAANPKILKFYEKHGFKILGFRTKKKKSNLKKKSDKLVVMIRNIQTGNN